MVRYDETKWQEPHSTTTVGSSPVLDLVGPEATHKHNQNVPYTRYKCPGALCL